MQAELAILREQMVSFLLLPAIGYCFCKTKLIDSRVVDAIPSLIMKFVLPAMLLGKLPAVGTWESLMHMGGVLAAIALMFGPHMLFAFLSGKLLRLKQPTMNVHLTVCGLPNSAFVGYPLLFIMFPDDTALFMATYMPMDSFMLFGVTPVLLNPDHEHGLKKFNVLISVSNVCLVIGIAMLSGETGLSAVMHFPDSEPVFAGTEIPDDDRNHVDAFRRPFGNYHYQHVHDADYDDLDGRNDVIYVRYRYNVNGGKRNVETCRIPAVKKM